MNLRLEGSIWKINEKMLIKVRELIKTKTTNFQRTTVMGVRILPFGWDSVIRK